MSKSRSTEDRKRYEVLNRMLQDRQAEIQTKLRSLRQVLPAEVAQVRDAEEQSMEEFVLGMDFALMEMESETLRKIDEAIRRLGEGSYGACRECDEEISEARLRALPFANLCRDCQAEEEETLAARNARPSRVFDDGPAPSPRERRVTEKASKGWSVPARQPEAKVAVSKPARVARAR